MPFFFLGEVDHIGVDHGKPNKTTPPTLVRALFPATICRNNLKTLNQTSNYSVFLWNIEQIEDTWNIIEVQIIKYQHSSPTLPKFNECFT